MAIDVDQARAETEGCSRVVHLNNAGAALMPGCVVEAQTAHIRREARLGGYEAADAAADDVARTYTAAAELLNCRAADIALTDSATTAWDAAFHAMPFAPGDRVLTSMAEYASNYIAFLQARRRHGIVVEPVPDDDHGQLDTAALADMIDGRTKLIAVTHVPTNGGLVNPAAAIGRVARAHGVPFLLDACQSAGQMPLDVTAIGCDILTATGRKFLRGPRGTGLMYVNPDILHRLEPPMLDLRGGRWTEPDAYRMRPDARRFETFEFNYAAVIGLGVAIDYALSWGLPAIAQRVTWLAETLRRRLARVPGLRLHDRGAATCGIVTFTLDGVAAADAHRRLRAHGIHVSVADPHSTLLDSRARDLPPLLRASVHYYNTEAELDRLVEALTALGAEAA
jgi:selenocysteine lyase/cysteine desulfurase